MKAIFKVILFLIPILLLFGLVRFYLNGMRGDLIPPYETFLGWFQAFPDIGKDWSIAVSKFNSEATSNQCLVNGDSFGDYVSYAWCYITTKNDVFTWFEGFSSVLTVIVSTPFRVLGWFFSIFVI